MRGYTVLYLDNGILISSQKVLKGLEKAPMKLDVVIEKNSNGWKSPKLPVTLTMREERGQIESIGGNGIEGGILTINSFLKGNVSKLLFNGKNFSPTIVKRIEKLLMPPKGSKTKIKQIIIKTDEGKWILNPEFIPNKD
jgi:hypothetical protein